MSKNRFVKRYPRAVITTERRPGHPIPLIHALHIVTHPGGFIDHESLVDTAVPQYRHELYSLALETLAMHRSEPS